MRDDKDNLLIDLTFKFALSIINFCELLETQKSSSQVSKYTWLIEDTAKTEKKNQLENQQLYIIQKRFASRRNHSRDRCNYEFGYCKIKKT